MYNMFSTTYTYVKTINVEISYQFFHLLHYAEDIHVHVGDFNPQNILKLNSVSFYDEDKLIRKGVDQ